MDDRFALGTPVVLIVFNRPELTRQVIEALARVRPAELFVVADGPRPDEPRDAQRCAAARRVATDVSWPCRVAAELAETNLGCATRVATGLDWVFEQVEQAIVLEDDCVPDPSFFRFCQELLDRYRADERVAVVSGTNVQFGRNRVAESYYFSRYNHCWGWATWRRAWRNFDFAMEGWPRVRDEGTLAELLDSPRAVRYWTHLFDRTAAGAIDSWAYRWTFACWVRRQLSILPAKNLVRNAGFGEGATHTGALNRYAFLTANSLEFPLRHPPEVVRHEAADRYTERTMFSGSAASRCKDLAVRGLRRIVPESAVDAGIRWILERTAARRCRQ
ncbi:MAG: hemolytic protein HlpA [Deferrisomatales bacterium]